MHGRYSYIFEVLIADKIVNNAGYVSAAKLYKSV